MSRTFGDALKASNFTIQEISKPTKLSIDVLKELLDMTFSRKMPHYNLIVGLFPELMKYTIKDATGSSSGYYQEVVIGELRKPDEAKTDLNLAPTRNYDEYGFENFHIAIDNGGAPDELIAELLANFSILYRMMGGSGINFEIIDVEVLNTAT